MWIVNIGGQVAKCEGSPVAYCGINGGLVVPLYYIFLALLGGAISLTRRVPEFQLQASNQYNENDPSKPKLEPHRLREYLVFQIVQFISAPLIAVVAYYLISPDNIATSVAIAFTAGFSSEAILHMIRTLIDKITPQNAPKQNPA